MLDENRYFVISTDSINLEDILLVCIEDVLDPISIDGTKGICKLPLLYDGLPSCLEGIQEYTQKQIVVERNKPEWQNEIDF